MNDQLTNLNLSGDTYQIKVRGILDQRWSRHFGDMIITHDGDETTLAGTVADQAALHGILMRIRDLSLPLLLVKQENHDDE